MKIGAVAAIGVKELMNQNACGILGPKDKYAVGITRIGVSAVNMKGSDRFPVGRKVPNRLVSQQENGMRLATTKELDNLGPQAPWDIVFLLRIREQGHDGVFCDAVLTDIGVQVPRFVLPVQGLFGQDLIKV